MIVTSVQIKTVKMQKHLYCPVFTDYVPDFTVRHIFLRFYAGLRAFFRFKKGLVSHYWIRYNKFRKLKRG